MTAFYELSFFPRSLFGLWAFLLCCAGIVGIVLSVTFRRHRYGLFSLGAFGISYYLWQIIFNIYRTIRNNPDVAPASSSVAPGRYPWLIWFVVLLAITFAALGTILLNVGYSRTNITPLAIKQCGDRMSCGICYWVDNGRVIFSNDCINRLCLSLTGGQLLNGNSFRDAVPEGTQTVGTEVWKFTCRDMMLDGRLLHEMIAVDVTETHAKTESLRRDNEELARMTEELKAYSLKIDDVVRRQEILQAKVNIHDEMNRLMLSTMATDGEDAEALDNIFKQWQKNALLLCREAEEKTEQNAVDQMNRLAQLFGLAIHWDERLPEELTEKQRELFLTAAREAIVNAVKHAEAKELKISFDESETGIRCIFENICIIPAGEVYFTGGLANLSRLAEEENAVLSAEAGETFRLTLCFPQNC